MLQTSVTPASAPRHFFRALSSGDTQLSAENGARVTVCVITRFRSGQRPSPLLDRVPSVTHQRRSSSSSDGRFGWTHGRGGRRTTVFRRFRLLWRSRRVDRRRLLFRRGRRSDRPRIRREPVDKLRKYSSRVIKRTL